MRKIIIVITLFLLCCLQIKVHGIQDDNIPFSRLYRIIKAERSTEIVILPEKNIINSRELEHACGKTQVLSIPIRIENNSLNEIKTNLKHEWYGGIALSSNLNVAVKSFIDGREIWMDGSGYLVGEKSSDNIVTIKPGEYISADVRLNWPGTGSCHLIEPLINENKLGKYEIKFLLLFKEGKATKFAETTEINIEVAQPQL